MNAPPKGLHLHFDPVSGIAGDMTVAALVDVGVPSKIVTDAIGAMKVPGLVARFERRKRGAFVGKGFVVTWPGSRPRAKKPTAALHAHAPAHPDHDHHDHHDHRDHAEIRRLLKRANLPVDARRLAGEIFERIAEVEAALHGVPVDQVTFHEVGAYDSIADVVGTAAAVTYLSPTSITSTPPSIGSGIVYTAHGPVAIPAPATAALLANVPTSSDGDGELVTPTGAAILASLVDEFGSPPPMRIFGQGFGAGTRELADRPNVLRVLLGETMGQPLAGALCDVLIVAANIDDMNPQLVEPLMVALFAAGALDAWTTPIIMKKGRPALEVSALCQPAHRPAVERAFFENSTTLGVRAFAAHRTVLGRSLARVMTSYGPIAVKVAAIEGHVTNAVPEFADCQKLAARARVPVRRVWAEATAAAEQVVAAAVGSARKSRD